MGGTVSEDIRSNPKDIEIYFEHFARVPGLSLQPSSYRPTIQVFGDVAISSGYYTFVHDAPASAPQGQGKSVVPARFTFVYRRIPDESGALEWHIVNHLSSKFPSAPASLRQARK